MRAIHFTGKRGPVRRGGRRFASAGNALHPMGFVPRRAARSDLPATPFGGFTLIEMLVVVAIILILARLLLPLARSAKNMADTAACASNLRQIALGTRIYMDSTGHGFPYVNQCWASGGGSWQWGFRRTVSYALGKTNRVFWCPAHDEKYENFPARYEIAANWDVGSYGYNVCIGQRVCNNIKGSGDPCGACKDTGGGAGRDNYFWYNVTKSFAEVILTGDSEDDNALLDTNRLVLRNWSRGTAFGIYGMRHNGKGNLAFLDGHVELLSEIETHPTLYLAATGVPGYYFPDTLADRAMDRWIPDTNFCSYPQTGTQNGWPPF